jgi:hypothetical protein
MVTKRRWIESCRSCQYFYKDKVNIRDMCCVYQRISTKNHVNQNGHIRLIVTGVDGHSQTEDIRRNKNHCDKYVKHPRRPQSYEEYAE